MESSTCARSTTNSFSPIPTSRASYEQTLYFPPGRHPDRGTLCTGPLWVGLPVILVILLGGLTTNFLWCVLLHIKNSSAHQYFSSTVKPVASFVLPVHVRLIWVVETPNAVRLAGAMGAAGLWVGVALS